MVNNFIEGLMTYRFLQNALLTSLLVGLVAGVIGAFIILRGMSLMGDALSHAVLPGVAVSYMLGINYIIGASLFGVAAAGLIGYLDQNSKLKSDTTIGIVFSSFFALGIVLINKAQSSTDLTSILFGNVLAVRESDIIITAVVTVAVLLFVIIFYKELQVSSFDPMMAQAYGLKVKLIHYALMFALTLVAVTSLQTIGAILVLALLVTPAATAFLLTNKLKQMIVLSALVGMLSGVIGLFFSYNFNYPSGATIVLTATFFFVLAFLFSPKQGIVFRQKAGFVHEEN